MDIPIINDCVVEESGEVFNVHLRRSLGLNYRIRLSSESTVVNITDNGNRNSEVYYYHYSPALLLVLLVGLEQTSYTALESDESVEVCAVIANNCTEAFSLLIRFRTLDGSAGTDTTNNLTQNEILLSIKCLFADVVDDYTPQNRLLRFSANKKRLCVNISIVNDLELEPRESFGIALERTPDTDDRISIQQDVGKVHIENDDGEVIRVTL